MKYHRELTFAEKKVDFNKMNQVAAGLSKLLDKKLLSFISSLSKKKTTDKQIQQLVNIVTLIQKEAFELGKKSASKEMKVNTPPTNKEMIKIMKQNNTEIIKKMISDINIRLEEKGFSEEGIVKKFLNGLKTLFVYGSINMGREVIFESHPELIYAFEYSAILDGATTDLCRSLDGMVIKPNNPKRKKYNPPNHWNCRSIWVEILMEEVGKPKMNSKTPEDSKNIMKSYKKDNKEIENLTNKVIEEQRKEIQKNTSLEYQKDILSKIDPLDIDEYRMMIKDRNINIKEKFGLSKDFNLLTDQELWALRDYTFSSYSTLNSYLLGGRSELYRGDGGVLNYLVSGLNKLDSFKGDVYRGMQLTEELDQIFGNFKKGDTFVNKNFFSTSENIETAKAFSEGLFLNIKSKNGKRVDDFSENKGEDEVLFNIGTNFTIKDIKKTNGKIEVWLEEIDSQQFKEIQDGWNKIELEYIKQLKKRRKTNK